MVGFGDAVKAGQFVSLLSEHDGQSYDSNRGSEMYISSRHIYVHVYIVL